MVATPRPRQVLDRIETHEKKLQAEAWNVVAWFDTANVSEKQYLERLAFAIEGLRAVLEE
jgi:hypothetical protein